MATLNASSIKKSSAIVGEVRERGLGMERGQGMERGRGMEKG